MFFTHRLSIWMSPFHGSIFLLATNVLGSILKLISCSTGQGIADVCFSYFNPVLTRSRMFKLHTYQENKIHVLNLCIIRNQNVFERGEKLDVLNWKIS